MVAMYGVVLGRPGTDMLFASDRAVARAADVAIVRGNGRAVEELAHTDGPVAQRVCLCL